MSTSVQEKIDEEVIQIRLNVQVFALTDNTAKELDRELSQIESLQHRITRSNSVRPLMENLGDTDVEFPDVVIVELSGNNQETLADIKQFVEEHGEQTEVFTTFASEEIKLMPLMMRSGVRDVLPLPVSHQDLIVALSNTLARHRRSPTRAQDKKGAVMAFMSTRGGAGGPFLATNIAYLLRTKFNRRTVLIDMDIQYGTTAYDLDIKSDGGVVEALRSPGRIDFVFLEALITRHSSGLDVLPAPADLSSWDGLSPKALSRLVSVLSGKYEHIVMNLPMYINDVVEQAMVLSNPIFLVTQDTISMLRNLNMMLQRLPKRGISLSKLEVIHNRSGAGVKAVKSYELEKLIRDVPLHRVRSDYKLAARAENEGKPVGELQSRAGIIKDMTDIAQHIVNFDAEKPVSPKRSTRRWFS